MKSFDLQSIQTSAITHCTKNLSQGNESKKKEKLNKVLFVAVNNTVSMSHITHIP